MSPRKPAPADPKKLRAQAEARLAKRASSADRDAPDAHVLLQELEVHQVELEMQNEELLRVGDELQVALLMYTELYDFAPVGYLTLEGDGTIVGANFMAGEVLGVERARLVGQRFGLHVSERAVFNAALGRALADGAQQRCNLTLTGPFEGGLESDPTTGRPKQVELTLRAAEGGGTCRAVLSDVTERKRVEEQLQSAQKMEALGRMAGGVAHDFNNLLTVILSHAEFALEAVEPASEAHEDLVGIKLAADRSAALTRQLLAFSRREVVERQRLDLNRLAEGLASMLRRVVSTNIELVLSLAPDLARVEGDRVQLEQVLMNLALNARDAMPDGGTLTIATANHRLRAEEATRHADLEPGDFVRLTVSDTGVGMDGATLSRIFEPFFTTKGREQGTGFGLSTVYGIVQQCAGDIAVRSEPGAGTTFEIFLPCAAALRELVSGAPTAPRPAARCTETILVVEDQEALLQLTKRILVASGYTVLTARGGLEALAACAELQGPVHLLLTDVVMPEMTGTELAERLLQARPATRVLYMSGFTSEAFDGIDLRGRALAFIGKPFTAEALRRKVRQTLDDETSEKLPL